MTEAQSESLTALADIARQLGADDLAAEAGRIAVRIAENLFYVACVGQFKRGKSTLLNTLIGTLALPTGVLPVTALITIVRFGESRGAMVRFVNGETRMIEINELADYVTEERNPRNVKEVAVVEVEIESPLLSSGMCLVDTPGLGSVFGESSEITRRFLPHVDAALLVVGADPPLSGEEAALAEEMIRETPHLLVVLSKADRLSGGDIQQAASFARATLEKRIAAPIELFIISATEPLTRDWKKLEQKLAALAREAGGELVEAARGRAIRRLASRLRREIEEHRRALLAPVRETEQSVAQAQARIAEAQRALDDLSFLFASEEQKLSRSFAAERDRFLATVVALASDEQSARQIAENKIEEWRREMEPKAEQMFASATARFADRLRELGASDDFDPHLRTRQRFYFTALPELTGRSFFRKGDTKRYLQRLLETNAERVMNDLIDRVVESRRELERDIRGSLRGVVLSMERAATHARDAKEAGHDRLVAEIAQLDNIAAELIALQKR